MRRIAALAILSAVALAAIAASADAQPRRETPRGHDRCGASGFRHLVGGTVAQARFALAGRMHRFVRTGGPMTMDWRPNRITAFTDQAARRVESVRCVN